MKKHFLKIFSFIFVLAFILTGCATVSNVKNENPDLIYNGGNVVMVGNHLYFANAYTPVGSSDTNFAYKASAKFSYLNRLDLSADFGTEKPVDSPKGAEKVNSKVIGYENQHMFVLGNYIYFTSANTHKTDKLENTYSLVTFFRCKLNGDGQKEIFTTNQFDSAKAKISVVKGSDDNYYLVVYDGSELSSIRLGNSLGSRKVIAKDVQSVAIPDESDEYAVKDIFYTVKHKDENGDETEEVDIFRVNLASGESKSCGMTGSGAKVSFIDRVGDIVIYSNSAVIGGNNECFYEDISKTTNFNGANKFYSRTAISGVEKICAGDPMNEGYIFVSDDNLLMYKNTALALETETLLNGSDYNEILFVNNDRVYYSTSSGLYWVSVKDKTRPHTILEMEGIVAGQASFVDNYIYFFAPLDIQEEEDVEGETKVEYEDDTNNYMYRIQCDGNGGYQMLSTYKRVEKKTSTN